MSDPQGSPISQLLRSLGITREDLEKRSDQMRQFLTAENFDSLRVSETSNSHKPSSADTRPISKPVSSTASFTRSRSRANSYTVRDATPPVTPVKSEPVDGTGLPRHFDSMEMVIERQRRQNRREKKERRERERESRAGTTLPQPPSPSPGDTSQNRFHLDSFMQSRVDTRVSDNETQESAGSTSSQGEETSAVPVTPQRNKYYRDHTNLSANSYSQQRKEQTALKAESPTPTRAPPPAQPLPSSQPQYFAYPQYLAYARLLPPLAFPSAQAGPSTLPVTPQHQRTHITQKAENSPLPPSSPPPASSPVTTPHRPVVNTVSSPGPMDPLPNEEEYDKLPYTLPPGPYSPNKPDLSYAALVGQAILSSPEHRLTLQEIYDWITIVYPHFKRGETTWMNSIRHVLSTTICFRKVTRERAIGRTQWAIWDEDLECFEGGGFRKYLCKDIINNTRGDQGSRAKGKGRKRADTDNGADARKSKRPKKDHPAPLSTAHVASSYMPATMSSHSLFPPTRPTSHHQPYYESCIQPQPLPADVIFPPLPAGVGYSRMNSNAAASSSSTTPLDASGDESMEATPSSTQSDARSAPTSSASSLSVPELTPNRSSSSPPPASSELGAVSSTVEEVCLDDYITIGGDNDEPPIEEDENARTSFTTSLLSPVKYWGYSPTAPGKSKVSQDTLPPGNDLGFGGTLSSSDEDEQPLLTCSKGGKSPDARKLNKMSFPAMPTSPTLNRKVPSRPSKVSKPSAGKKSIDAERPAAPAPSTPPRSARQLPISSVRTPLSSKGVNPAALHSDGDDDDDQCAGELDLNKTPRKRVVSSGVPAPAPVTPRRLNFASNQNDSPYRTPAASGVFSPFRTPGSRSVFDPHDPAEMLDEELNRMGAGAGDSPAGLFGKGRGSLLYDSPGFSTSPGKYPRWW